MSNNFVTVGILIIAMKDFMQRLFKCWSGNFYGCRILIFENIIEFLLEIYISYPYPYPYV